LTFVGVENLNLSYFIFSQHKVIKISNNPTWMKTFLDTKLYLDYQRYKKEINNIPDNNYYFICRDNLPKNLLKSNMLKHDLHNVISLSIKSANYIEMFGIANQGQKVDSLSFYLNKYHQIFECISHIRNITMLNKLTSIPKYCYHYKDIIYRCANTTFLKLSYREEQCFSMITKGFTANQI
jgi:hypothetical protein